MRGSGGWLAMKVASLGSGSMPSRAGPVMNADSVFWTAGGEKERVLVQAPKEEGA